MRKVNAIISLWYGREIGNQVGNPNEPCRYPHQFFPNSYSSSPLETESSSKPRDATNGVPTDSDSSSLPELPSKKEELKEKESSNSVDPSPSKDSSSPSFAEKIHIPLPHFPHMLKKKDQAHVSKMRETFSQIKINILLLNALQ